MENKEIRLKLLIDGKEAETAMNLSNKQLVELTRHSEAFSGSASRWGVIITDFTKTLANEFPDYINAIDQTLNVVQNAVGKMYSIIQSEAKHELKEWRTTEESKLEFERKAALNHAKTSKEKQKINEEYNKKKDELDALAHEKEYERLSAWFSFQKALAVAQIAVQMAQAVAKGYGELGPIGGAIAMGITIAALTAQAAAVASQKMPGYNLGGKLIPGKPGVFEGNQVEIVAPEKTFLDIMQNEYMPQLLKSAAITMSLMNTKQQINSDRNLINQIPAGSSELLKEMKLLNKSFQHYAENPVSPNITKSAILEMWRKGSAGNRRSKM